MSKFRALKRKFSKNFFKKIRLLIINEDTFEEKFSLRLSLMNVFLVVTISTIVIITATTYIIAFTPLREYIPGYSSSKLKKSATFLAIKSDSLETVIKQNNAYIASVKKVLTGDLQYAKLSKDSIMAAEQLNPSEYNLLPTEEELELRDQVAQEDKYNLFEKVSSVQNIVLFSPVKGNIVKSFSAKNKQFSVDINLPSNAAIKSVANGTVVFSEWTLGNGYVVIIKHKEGLLSVYKGCSSITKSQGDIVRTGEVVALGGSASKTTATAHLLFELWKDGYPIDPTSLIDFE